MRCFFPVAAVCWICVIAPPLCAQAQELERKFDALQFSYKLPGKDWVWAEDKIPNTAFLAVSPKDYRVLVAYMALPRAVALDQKFVDGFEKTYYPGAKMKKRGGRFLEYQNRPCYQAEALLSDGRTAITRLLLGQAYAYQLTVIGGVDPIENTPEFESIVNGFTLTAPPPVPEPEREPTNISYQMGKVVGYCLVGIIVLVFLKTVFGKKAEPKQQS